MDKLHKMVDGKKVFLTPEEEAQTRAEWQENDKIGAEKEAEEERKKQVINSAKEKLFQTVRLTEEEKELLFK